MEQWTYFKNLATLFEEHGYHLYMVGGSTRDFLLHKESDDLDLTTNATPEEMLTFLKDAQTTFMHFGTLRLSTFFGHVDITTFRSEKGYEDYRHPTEVEFVRELDIDAKRRDFTMNAIYIDLNQNILDPFNGQEDLAKGMIKTIGDPYVRFKEDPLRILRAVRFAMLLHFEIEEETKLAMMKEKDLILNMNPQKVEEEIRKMKKISSKEYLSFLEKYELLDVLSPVLKKIEKN